MEPPASPCNPDKMRPSAHTRTWTEKPRVDVLNIPTCENSEHVGLFSERSFIPHAFSQLPQHDAVVRLLEKEVPGRQWWPRRALCRGAGVPLAHHDFSLPGARAVQQHTALDHTVARRERPGPC